MRQEICNGIHSPALPLADWSWSRDLRAQSFAGGRERIAPLGFFFCDASERSGRSRFSQSFFSIATSAAAVSACFLLLPLPCPSLSSSHITSTTNVLACSGPLCEISLYTGL